MALLSLTDGYIYPVCRPISLKNQSISIISERFPDVVMSNVVENTAKGRIAHMRPPIFSINNSQVPATPAIVIFPKYIHGSNLNLSGLKRGDAFMKVIRNSFNYNVLGYLGFESLAGMISKTDCYEFEYHSLDDAFDVFDELALA
jgi:HprK-related kinase A